jgi:hypothetical protein
MVSAVKPVGASLKHPVPQHPRDTKSLSAGKTHSYKITLGDRRSASTSA